MTTTKGDDGLVYLDDYIDTLEAIPVDLQRNFTLLRELDGYAQDLMEAVSKEAVELIDTIKDLDPNTRLEKFKHFTTILSETLKRGEEKVALAQSTCDTVDRHCHRLDSDLIKFEQNQTLGDTRITTLPGLGPSFHNLKETSEMKERVVAKRIERKEKGEKKKRKTIKESNESSVSPSVLRANASKDARALKATDKARSYKTTKPKTVVPVDLPIDPNEPLYCYCQQVSFGEMVACDQHDCEIEWFHLACVDLKTVPKGKWYCDNCLLKSKAKQKK
ncbi:hypothetical protein BY458DRAFT_493726 [Sporodiniella umbellata]|nr:hypothetical protein BY458DRAFT_493726 [Sporodiniella umbellata]